MLIFRPTLDNDSLTSFVVRQANHLVPDGHDVSEESLRPRVAEAVTRVHDCFRNINKKYYREGNDILFSHLHSDHWSMFLYLLSNTLYRGGDESAAAKIFILNKALNGVDAFYGISLPETFLFVHPVGTVLGNAKYGNYFVTYQNCAIGATESGYPTFGDGVVFYAKSSCLGGCQIGDEVVFGANSFLIDQDVPSNSVVVGQFPGQKIRPNGMSARERVFGG